MSRIEVPDPPLIIWYNYTTDDWLFPDGSKTTLVSPVWQTGNGFGDPSNFTYFSTDSSYLSAFSASAGISLDGIVSFKNGSKARFLAAQLPIQTATMWMRILLAGHSCIPTLFTTPKP